MDKQHFFQQMSQFQLGRLPSENQHPLTIDLAQNARVDIKKALSQYRSVDDAAFRVLDSDWQSLAPLHQAIKSTLQAGGRIYMAGCGATGRLVLGLEKMVREIMPEVGDSIISFMAGGDLALVHSLESFEDYQEYGERQLVELGFTPNDLFIGVTEGGETPFVIGASIKAANVGREKAFFLFCNPPELLKDLTERTHQVLHHQNIHAIAFDIGPMALSGSTRLQACSVLQIAIGAQLFNYTKSFKATQEYLKVFLDCWHESGTQDLQALVEEESAVYEKNGFVHFIADRYSSLTVLTDTTERSPTFSLFPFENWRGHWKIPCWNYLSVEGVFHSQKAWEIILGNREARTLEWSELQGRASLSRLLGFDVSMHSFEKRKSYLPRHILHKIFQVSSHHESIILGMTNRVSLQAPDHFLRQSLLKMNLNQLSTIVMGRVGRYHSNVMTWVRPSNNKLIDRTIRNAQMLLKEKTINVDYMQLANKVFELLPNMQNDRSLVLELVQVFS